VRRRAVGTSAMSSARMRAPRRTAHCRRAAPAARQTSRRRAPGCGSASAGMPARESPPRRPAARVAPVPTAVLSPTMSRRSEGRSGALCRGSLSRVNATDSCRRHAVRAPTQSTKAAAFHSRTVDVFGGAIEATESVEPSQCLRWPSPRRSESPCSTRSAGSRRWAGPPNRANRRRSS
jgi:hypothetical protein